MKVQIRGDKAAIRVELPPDGELSMEEAVQLARDLIDAVTQCGHQVKLDVEVPRHQPTDVQLQTAIQRVAHLRKSLDGNAPWNDVKVNSELVMRVLGACL